MLGDILLITEKHEKAAKQIVGFLSEIHKKKIVIAVGGESGSGKSELAHSINSLLKKNGEMAKTIHSDNYYKVPPKERTLWRQKNGVESIGLNEYDWNLINKHLDEFHNNKKPILPCIDLLTDQIDQLHSDFNGIKYLIVEGLYSVAVEADIRVFIDLTYHETKKAQIVRGKEPQNDFRLKVLQREHEVVRSLKPQATHIVSKDFNVVVQNT